MTESVETRVALIEQKADRQQVDIEKVMQTLEKVAELQMRNEQTIERFAVGIESEIKDHKKKVDGLEVKLQMVAEEQNSMNQLLLTQDAFRKQLIRDVKIIASAVSTLIIALWAVIKTFVL